MISAKLDVPLAILHYSPPTLELQALVLFPFCPGALWIFYLGVKTLEI
jgi:hypothetical protein